MVTEGEEEGKELRKQVRIGYYQLVVKMVAVMDVHLVVSLVAVTVDEKDD